MEGIVINAGEIIIMILTTVLGVVGAWNTYLIKKRERRDEHAAKLEQEQLEEHRRARHESDTKLDSLIVATANLTKTTETLTEQMSTVQERISKLDSEDGVIHGQLTNITTQITDMSRATSEIGRQSKQTSEYVVRLSRLTSALARGIRDSNVDGNITDAASDLQTYQNLLVQQQLGVGYK